MGALFYETGIITNSGSILTRALFPSCLFTLCMRTSTRTRVPVLEYMSLRLLRGLPCGSVRCAKPVWVAGVTKVKIDLPRKEDRERDLALRNRTIPSSSTSQRLGHGSESNLAASDCR